jgi:hypothetical protein
MTAAALLLTLSACASGTAASDTPRATPEADRSTPAKEDAQPDQEATIYCFNLATYTGTVDRWHKTGIRPDAEIQAIRAMWMGSATKISYTEDEWDDLDVKTQELLDASAPDGLLMTLSYVWKYCEAHGLGPSAISQGSRRDHPARL